MGGKNAPTRSHGDVRAILDRAGHCWFGMEKCGEGNLGWTVAKEERVIFKNPPLICLIERRSSAAADEYAKSWTGKRLSRILFRP